MTFIADIIFLFFSPLKHWYPVLVRLQIIRSQTFQMLIITHLKDYDKLLLLNAGFKYLEVSLYKPASFSHFVLISSAPEKYWVPATVLHMLDPVSALPCDVPATGLFFTPPLLGETPSPKDPQLNKRLRKWIWCFLFCFANTVRIC